MILLAAACIPAGAADRASDTDAVRASAYAFLMASGYTVNHRSPPSFCLGIADGWPATTLADPSPAAFPAAAAEGPQVKRASQCPEGGVVLYTARVKWLDDARAMVEAGVLRLHSRYYRTWKERADRRSITIEWQPDLGWVATGMEITAR
ncbi:MAG TPA: hypothetical protein VGQ33_24695 [Vicinamibacteria bacterium]|nr:hypothetical protein [Vicinamibacteria bacterium]